MTTTSVKMLRTGAFLTLAIASGITAQARGLDLNEPAFYNDSADAHKVLSFNFDDKGIDEKSISFLENQKRINETNAETDLKQRVSQPQDIDFLLKSNSVPSNDFSQEGYQYKEGLEASSTLRLEPSLEKYRPRNLHASTQSKKPSMLANDTSWYAEQNKIQFADLTPPKPVKSTVEIALLP